MNALMMPFLRVRDFLATDKVAQLLDWTLTEQAEFSPALIDDSDLNVDVRRATAVRPPREIRHILRDKLKPRMPEIFRQTGIRDFDWKAEVEVAAHGDGAMFARHVDTGVRSGGAESRRISAVYYYHCEPKKFSGGCLRLHALRGDGFIDIEPEHNMLLVFASYAPHEVRPVSCPSGLFADSRFAANIWLHDAVRFKDTIAANQKRELESLAGKKSRAPEKLSAQNY